MTENFGVWQDRSSFFGVVEGYVWIGSEKAFPWAQIGIVALAGCLLYVSYVSFMGIQGTEAVSHSLFQRGYRVVMAELGLTVVFTLAFVLFVMDSDWWWLDTGFYGALIAGLVDLWVYRQLV
ncbi:MAG: hypothetical protein NWE89_11880 [Candidatus Bathyarchaeota archaeon]|nr:hypothetical protein [Candidatus Bathyarchaeota archaeon]